MAAEENKAVVRRYWEDMWNGRNIGAIEALVAPEELEEVKRFYTLFVTSSTDLRVVVEDMFANGDHVVDRVTFTGTHDGPLTLPGMSVPPTGKRLKIQMVEIWRMRDGKIAGHKGEWDRVGLIRQLGLTPGAAQPAEQGG